MSQSHAYRFAALAALIVMSASAAPTPMSRTAIATLVTEGSIQSVQAAIYARRTTCVDVVQAYLARIRTLDKARGLNAITQINPAATADAQHLDDALKAGRERGELFCVPLLVKDNIDTEGMATTAGSIAMLGNRPTEDAFIVRRLKAAGAIVLAKTNMAEWAFSPRDTVSSSHGVTANAYDQTRTPAGSSGGTAAGVAVSLGLAGLGTDTGNSVRGPSAHAGLVGLRPTLGLISRSGIVPLQLDLDTAGPMTRTVEDNARLLNVLAAEDGADAMTLGTARHRPADYTAFLKVDALKGAHIGVLRALAEPKETDPRVLARFERSIKALRRAGAVIVDPVTVPNFRKHLDDGYYCSRFAFDANNYLRAHPSAPVRDVRDVFASGAYAPQSRSDFERFLRDSSDDPTKGNPPCGVYLDHPGRRAFLGDVEFAMESAKVDSLIYPTWLILPPRLAEARSAYQGDNSQLVAPATGMPAITIPAGTALGLPVGLQFVARRFDEGRLYGLAYAYEQHTHDRRRPAGFAPLR